MHDSMTDINENDSVGDDGPFNTSFNRGISSNFATEYGTKEYVVNKLLNLLTLRLCSKVKQKIAFMNYVKTT